MSPLLFLLFLATSDVEAVQKDNAICNGHQADFDLKSVLGTWHVVAIIPGKLFPDHHKEIRCYEVEFSEIDEAGLRWLVNNTLEMAPKAAVVEKIRGVIIRQRYHSEKPFDVWSRSVENVNGCFQQVLSLDTDMSEISKAITQDATMQLHEIEGENGTGPFLLQILWGKMISAVIYRRQVDVTQDQLKPVFEFMSRLRGPQRIPRICSRPLKDLFKYSEHP